MGRREEECMRKVEYAMVRGQLVGAGSLSPVWVQKFDKIDLGLSGLAGITFTC